MKRTLHWLLIAVSVIGLCACGDDDTQDSGNGATVEVSTKAISEITATTAVSGGVITGEDGASVSARGVCWSKSSAPTTSDFKTSDGSGLGEFTSKLTGLENGVVYYVRAYAVSGKNTVYGDARQFTAGAATPTVTTAQATEVEYRTAVGGGTVDDPGASEVTACGICWSTSENPTTDDDNVEGDPEETTFSLPMENLSSGTTYYVRAFATNSAGTGYGAQVSFTTKEESLVTIEDAAFRQYCLDNFDLDYDGKLQASEAVEVTEINCSDLGITSLKGIEHFTNLRSLLANDNPLSAVDLSQNRKLTRLELIRTAFETLTVSDLPVLESLLCDGLKENVVGTLKSLTVKDCPALKEVFCQENSLSTLVFTDCPELALLRCNTNQLTAVDLSGCPKLEEFYAWDNQLASLDLSGNKALKLLELQRNRFTTLEVADMPDLQHIWCDGLHKENGEDVVGCITTLAVRNCPKLEELFCQENSISSLTVSGCPGLIKLCGWRNALTTLDLTGCESLATLQIAANQLSTVTLKGCAALDLLDIPDNRLTSLDLSDCINLRETWMQGNPTLTSLDLSKNNALQIFRCMATGIKSLDLSNHAYLTSVWCDGCGMESISVNGCPQLNELKCQNNLLTSLDVKGCPKLSIFWGDTNNLSEADFSGCGELTECNIQINKTLSVLNVTGCTKLKTLSAWDCGIKALDLSTNDNLELVQVNDNKLTSLAVHGKKLHDVHCVRNQLTSFTATDAPALIVIWIHDNLLTSLDVSQCAPAMNVLGIYAPGNPAENTNPLKTLYIKSGQTFVERYVPETAQTIVK